MIYLDTSVFVRRFLTDEGPDPVGGTALRGERMVLSEITRVEFRSVVARRRRGGRLSHAQADRVLEEFRIRSPAYDWIPLDGGVIERATSLVDRHALRSLDALQLAAALVAAEDSPEPLRFGCLDARLNAAARAEGLEILGA